MQYKNPEQKYPSYPWGEGRAGLYSIKLKLQHGGGRLKLERGRNFERKGNTKMVKKENLRKKGNFHEKTEKRKVRRE
jgi:hypothetical protein